MDNQLGGTQPILCAQQIRRVDQLLIDLLASLAPNEWELPTIAGQWRVRDVAAHLLDTALRRLSMSRDNCRLEPVEIHSPQDIARLVNRLNSEGVAVYRRLSPAVLVDLMRLACGQAAAYFESLDPFAKALGVSWAGEDVSLAWFDTARELTERWHHQQQIRLAVNRPGALTPDLYYPVLDTFMRGLPHAFRDIPAAPGSTVLVDVSGDCGGRWCLSRSPGKWEFLSVLPSALSARVIIPQSIAWRIFTRGISREDARSQVAVAGDPALAGPVLGLTAIVA